MNLLRIERVLSLPETLEPSTMYIARSEHEGLVEVHFTNLDGSSSRKVIGKTEIESMVNTAIAGFNNILIATNIADRNSMTLERNSLVLVLDATGDEGVSNGAALYIYNYLESEFIKVSEFESLDLNLTWDNIQDKPNSSPAQIDAAVDNSHMHENMSSLQKIGEDGQGNLTYNGSGINANVTISDW